MAEIAQSTAGLRLSGDDLDPIELTGLLGGKPTYAIRKGDLHTYPPNRPPRLARTGIWRLSSEYDAGDQLDRQISDILSALTPDVSVWADLVRRFKVDMFCGVWLNEENQGLTLTPQALLMLGTRGIEFNLDIYYEPPKADADDGSELD